MLDLRMNKLKVYHISLMTIAISVLLFLIPFESHSDNLDDWGVPEYQRMISPESSFNSGFNFLNANVQYQVRDISGGLVCIIQSDNITIYDAQITFHYLSNHPSRTIFENNGEPINYVVIKESWNVGEGDTFLSALRNMLIDPETDQPYSIFFGTTNGCAIQPGDKVTVIWEVVYN